MKLLNEYLSTKIKNNTRMSISNIPETPNFYDYLKFFEENEFKEMIYDESLTIYGQMNKRSMNSEKPLFMFRKKLDSLKPDFSSTKRANEWVRFCNKGEINKDNPIFFLRVTDDGHEIDKERYKLATIQYDDIIFNRHSYDNYEEFFQIVKKYF